MSDHRRRTVEEFTRQVDAYASAPEIRDEEALRLLVESARMGPDDTALDVACGPGIVTCALARIASRVVGVDLTPAMIEKARELERDGGLGNVEWLVGDAGSLPCGDESFSLVVSRYAFHHAGDPARVLGEMRRVLRAGGRVVVADVAPSRGPAKAAAFNRMERLRDPSHVRALRLEELTALLADAGLPDPRIVRYRVSFEMEYLLEGSSASEEDKETIRHMIRKSVEDDSLGLDLEVEDGRIRVAYPIAVVVSEKPTAAP